MKTMATDIIFDPSTDIEGLEPLGIFGRWLDEAKSASGFLATAMSLATVSRNGAPDVRMVLLQAVSAGGLVFFTNLNSAKGQHLQINSSAAACFHWPVEGQQVRLRGPVECVTNSYADEYFANRPRGAQIGAHASAQSAPIPGRATLEARLRELEEQFVSGPVPRPEHWTGLRLIPDEIEFWEDGSNRLHDRLLFTRKAEDDGWTAQRLSP
jgi:pyridoxamine 5'-phosphate oxidase